MLTPDQITPILPQFIDNTGLTTLRACPRRYYENIILGLRLDGGQIHLHAGGCFAKAREVFNKEFHLGGKDLLRAKRKALQAFHIAWGDFETPDKYLRAKDPDTVWLAFENFLATYPPLTDHVQPYFIDGVPTFEHKFAIPLDPADGWPLHPVTGQPFVYTGRFDMLGTWHGKPCVEDDKTGSQAGDTWSDQWTLRSQFIGYCWACQKEGIPVEHVVIRGVILQKTNMRNLEAVKHYPPHLIEDWVNRTKWDLELLCHYWKHDFWPNDLSDACFHYGACPHMDVCRARPENKASLRRAYIVKRWDPLADDTEVETIA